MKRTLPGWPEYSPEEVDAVSEMLRSGQVNYWTGNQIRSFESEFAKYIGTEHAIAVANGTLALELALRAYGIGPGDEVIVTPRSFIASASAAVNVGANPVFADVDLQTQALSSKTIEKVISDKTRAIIVVHLGGMPADMDPIMELAASRNIKVIVDCAQAHGAVYKGRLVGSIGHAAAWSFCQEKIISTGGEGGMVTSNDSLFIDRCWSYRDHGKTSEVLTKPNTAPPGHYRWVHSSVGSNFRMLEFQAVIGRIQLRKLNGWLEIRERNALTLATVAKELPGVSLFPITDKSQPAYYKLYLKIEDLENASAEERRNRIVQRLHAAGVPCGSGACPELYREQAFEGEHKTLPNAASLGDNTLMLNVHPTLSVDDMSYIGDLLSDAVLCSVEPLAS